MNVNREIAMTANKAADLIQINKWGQGPSTWLLGAAVAPGQRLCLEGGIMAAAGIQGMNAIEAIEQCPTYRAVEDYLRPQLVNLPCPISRDEGDTKLPRLWDWNDEDGRTAEEVIEVLRAVAVIHDARADAEENVTTEQVAEVSA